MPTGAELFVGASPTLENCWRSIILFGRNVASYKFALGKALIQLAAEPGDLVSLDQLAEPFAASICDHLARVDKQGTSGSSRFLDACRKFKDSNARQQLIDATVQLGFANVIDAFHIVNQGPVPVRFFIDERKTANGIRLTDDLRRLREQFQFRNLPAEVEARWRLVETAWELNLPRHAVAVKYSPEDESLVVDGAAQRRRSITGCRDALNGYQKGVCFYCNASIALAEADVDHFFPHVLKGAGFAANVDGIWNLVLACRQCNRGADGKSARVPDLPYLERLHRRAEFLIAGHLPLREALMLQTGMAEAARRSFLQQRWNEAVALLIHKWQPVQREEEPQ